MSAEVENALRRRINELENLVQELKNNTRDIGKIVSDPYIENGTYFYRIQGDGSKEYMLPTLDPVKIKKGTEIVYSQIAIVKILPEVLSNKDVLPEFHHIGWDEVGGMKAQIEEIRQNIEYPILMRDKYRAFGVEPSKGALLYGPPGCGKTLIAKVIASQIISKQKGNINSFQYVKGPELLNRFVGNSEENIRILFAKARKNTLETGAQSVIFIDEADALLSERGSGISSDMGRTIIPQFLSEMDGFDEHSPFVLLSTNYERALDPAVIRDGRIDIKVEIKRPTREDAEDIFGIHLKKVKCTAKISDLSYEGAELITERANGSLSGAMIRTVVNNAARHAIFRNAKGVEMQDLRVSIETHSYHI